MAVLSLGFCFSFQLKLEKHGGHSGNVVQFQASTEVEPCLTVRSTISIWSRHDFWKSRDVSQQSLQIQCPAVRVATLHLPIGLPSNWLSADAFQTNILKTETMFDTHLQNIKMGINIIYLSISIHFQVMVYLIKYNELTLAYLELVVWLIRKPASQGTWKRVLGLTEERQPTSWRLAQTVSASLKPRAPGRNLFLLIGCSDRLRM